VLLVSGCGSSDTSRLDVRVDAARSSFPGNWQVSAQYGKEVGHSSEVVAGGERVVSAARGANSSVFHLRGSGRYHIGVVVTPRNDPYTLTGCAKVFKVAPDTRYVATIHLVRKLCNVTVSRGTTGSAAG